MASLSQSIVKFSIAHRNGLDTGALKMHDRRMRRSP